MITLNADEARVLGVLIEKATTTPEQYPLSLNAVVSGCNQKNNRDPVLTMGEDQVFDALELLREKQLVVRVNQAGARVHKYKHTAGETLQLRSGDLAMLGELLLRGPQTLGELRGRAARMHPMQTLDEAKEYIRGLSERPEPLIKEIPPAPGTRAMRYVQLLSADLHPQDLTTKIPAVPASTQESSQTELEQRVADLEEQVARLSGAMRSLAASLDLPDPLGEAPPS